MKRGVTAAALVYGALGLVVFGALAGPLQGEIQLVLPQVDNATRLMLDFFTAAAFITMLYAINESTRPVQQGMG
jgi:hypothetical protein